MIGEEEITNERVDINQKKKENKRSILIDIAGCRRQINIAYFFFFI
jgi:hypothetical protein